MTIEDGARAGERALAAIAERLGTDELDLLVLLAHRAVRGATRYGPLHVARDGRNFAAETLEELADALFYIGAALLRAQPRALLSRRPPDDAPPWKADLADTVLELATGERLRFGLHGAPGGPIGIFRDTSSLCTSSPRGRLYGEPVLTVPLAAVEDLVLVLRQLAAWARTMDDTRRVARADHADMLAPRTPRTPAGPR